MAKIKIPLTASKSSSKTPNDDNPFGALLENVKTRKGPDPVNLKAIQKPNSRKNTRIAFTGRAVIYNTNQKVLSRAVLRNISPGGIGFEISSIEIHEGMQVLVQFESPKLGLSLIECTVQWVALIEKSHNKMLGLKINKMSPSMQKQMENFFQFVIK